MTRIASITKRKPEAKRQALADTITTKSDRLEMQQNGMELPNTTEQWLRDGGFQELSAEVDPHLWT